MFRLPLSLEKKGKFLFACWREKDVDLRDAPLSIRAVVD